jgi:diacylglycerol kinase (ATP)
MLKKDKVIGIERLIYATKYSLLGLKSAWRYEAAFRQEVIVLIITILISFWLDITMIEKIALIGSVILVIIVELINSGIEAVVDRIGIEFNELSGRAKDLGSAAVFVTVILSLFVWVSVLWS